MIQIRRPRLLSMLLAAGLLTGGAFAAAPVLAQDGPADKGLALSTQLFELAGAKAMMVQMIDRISPSMTMLVQQANPGKEAEVAEVINGFIMPKIKERLPEMIHQGAIVYAKHFSAEELGQLVQFYESPIGRKLVREQPLMAAELGNIGQAWAQAVTVQAIQQYSEEFKKRGLQTPI